MSSGLSGISSCFAKRSPTKVFAWSCSTFLVVTPQTFGSGAYKKQRNEDSTITNSDGSDGKTTMTLNDVILTAGQLALALAGIASCIALLCIIVGMLRWLVRTVRAMGALPGDRRPSTYYPRSVDRTVIGGGVRGSARKW
jgi:hypothetical protein